jgi:hypothetical protein
MKRPALGLSWRDECVLLAFSSIVIRFLVDLRIHRNRSWERKKATRAERKAMEAEQSETAKMYMYIKYSFQYQCLFIGA